MEKIDEELECITLIMLNLESVAIQLDSEHELVVLCLILIVNISI